MPLSSIAERRSEPRTDESDEDDEDEDGGEGEDGRWGTEYVEGKVKKRSGEVESVIKAGYLFKKGERRKVSCGLQHPNLISSESLTDMEKTMVRPPACAPRVLQNSSRVPTATITRPR